MKTFTLLLLSASAVGAVDIYDTHYPPEVPTFNPLEFYKNATRPTITAYRACDKIIATSDLQVGTCSSTWIAAQTFPVPYYANDHFIDVQQTMHERLTWTGANTDYPLVIGLETTPKPTYRMERGELAAFAFSLFCPGCLHNALLFASALFLFAFTFVLGSRESKFTNPEAEYPGNLLDLNVEISEFVKHVNFTSNFPNKTTDAAMATFVYGVGAHSPLRFTIGQPQDPRWKDDASTQNGKVVDAGTPFFLSSPMSLPQLAHFRDDVAMNKWRDEERKWQLGAGIGVGVGVPVLLIAAFLVGRATGLKDVSRVPAKAAA